MNVITQEKMDSMEALFDTSPSGINKVEINIDRLILIVSKPGAKVRIFRDKKKTKP